MFYKDQNINQIIMSGLFFSKQFMQAWKENEPSVPKWG